MSKVGAAAILAIVTFANAQDCATEGSQCFGVDDSMKKVCCDELACVQKDEWYGQCLPVDAGVPDGWVGKMMTSDGELATEEIVQDDIETETVAPKPAEELDEDNDLVEMPPSSAPMPTEDIVQDDAETETVAPKPAEDVDEDAVDKEDGEKLPMQQTGAAVPIAAEGAVSYMAVPGKDYLPKGATPKLVAVEDVKPATAAGNTVLDQQECEDLCTAMEGCNAASYYLDGEKYGDLNCWLKIIANTCEVPTDADVDPNAVLLLKLDDACPNGLPALGPDSVAKGPISVALAPSSVDTRSSTTPGANSVGAGKPQTSATGVTVAPPSGNNAVSVQGAFIAMAVAGAAVAFI